MEYPYNYPHNDDRTCDANAVSRYTNESDEADQNRNAASQEKAQEKTGLEGEAPREPLRDRPARGQNRDRVRLRGRPRRERGQNERNEASGDVGQLQQSPVENDPSREHERACESEPANHRRSETAKTEEAEAAAGHPARQRQGDREASNEQADPSRSLAQARACEQPSNSANQPANATLIRKDRPSSQEEIEDWTSIASQVDLVSSDRLGRFTALPLWSTNHVYQPGSDEQRKPALSPASAEKEPISAAEWHARRDEKCTTSDCTAQDAEEKCATSAPDRGDSVAFKWTPRRSLSRVTCERETRDAIFIYVPAARDDEIIFRYVVYALWTSWFDEGTKLPVISEEVLHWIGGYQFDAAKEVADYIKKRIPGFVYEGYIAKRRCRLIERDGLPGRLWQAVQIDLETPPSEYVDRVYVLSGKAYNADAATRSRKEIRKDLAEIRHAAPSLVAQRNWERLNSRSSNRLARIKDHIEDANEHLGRMDIEVMLSKKERNELSELEQWELKRKKRRQQRRRYYQILTAVADQHQPFYAFSRVGRTDRLFSYNKSALELPKPLRSILFQDFYEIDLKSAHLLIAAWLWDADEALETLADEAYSIWDDLIEHYRSLFSERDVDVPKKGDALYETVKAALKVALYSVVFGMPAPSLQAKLTIALDELLGPEAGARLREHWLIKRLLEKRDEKLAEWDEIVRAEGSHTLHGPSGIEIVITQTMDDKEGKGVDAKSAMATLAQSYEQCLMSVILELEEYRYEKTGRRHFYVALWLHDGAYVAFRGKGEKRMKELNERLQKRCEELAKFAGKDTPLPAFFEFEKVEAPPMPEPVEEREEGSGSDEDIVTSDAGSCSMSDEPVHVTDIVHPTTKAAEDMHLRDETAEQHEAKRTSDKQQADDLGEWSDSPAPGTKAHAAYQTLMPAERETYSELDPEERKIYTNFTPAEREAYDTSRGFLPVAAFVGRMSTKQRRGAKPGGGARLHATKPRASEAFRASETREERENAPARYGQRPRFAVE